MANDVPQHLRYIPVGAEGVIEVNAHLVGGSLIDSLRRTFTTDSQMEEGDFFMGRSRNLLHRHQQLMLVREKVAIRQHLVESVFKCFVLCCQVSEV